VDWELISTKQKSTGATELQLRLLENERSQALWPYRSKCNLRIVAGETLKLELTTENQDDRVFILGEALHAYFVIGDIETVRLSGLDQVEYYDKVDDKTERQQGIIRFSGETDRVYMNTRSPCVIEDEQLGRCIIVDKTGSDSTVVWNPWQDRATEMADFGEDGWRRMLCLETANALDNRLILEPGETHTVLVEYRVENI
jgi:D-hexose-6-phosphate mutarotase